VTANDFALLEDTGTAFAAVLKGVTPQQLGEASACAGWSTKELADHVISGNLRFAGLVGGTPPAADSPPDDLGTAFATSLQTLAEAFAADGALERPFQTPMGERAGRQLLAIRIVEMSVHGWDLARSTGQAIELPATVVEAALTQLRTMLPEGERTGLPYGSEQPTPAGASDADRLAAFAGRKVL
jgi:uncharacterized protein (TIGR03086 family)